MWRDRRKAQSSCAWRAATILVALGVALPAAAEEQVVAIPAVKGHKRAAPKVITKVLRGAFEEAGKLVTAPPSSNRKKIEASGAGFFVSAKIVKKRRKFILKAELIDLESGRAIGRGERSYRGSRDAAQAARAVADGLIASMPRQEPKAIVPPEPIAQPEPPPESPSTGSTAPEPTFSLDLPRATEEEPEPARDGGKRKARLLLVEVAVGAKLLSGYTVSVADSATSLTYDLDPLLLVAPAVRFNIPSTAIGLEAEFGFAPVRWKLDVTPAVTPDTPTGSFMGVGGNVVYRLGLTEDLSLEPLLGARFDLLSVEDQEPYDLVVSHSVLAPHLGVRGVLAVGEEIELILDLRARLALSYSEKPVTTGDAGSGLGFAAGLGFRYWFMDALGFALDARFASLSQGFSGNGSRPIFQGDPQLVDASVSTSGLEVAAGVIVGL